MNYNTLRIQVQKFLKSCVPSINFVYTNFAIAEEFDEGYVSISHCYTDEDKSGYVEIVISRVTGSLVEDCVSHIRVTDQFFSVPKSAIGSDKLIN